MSRQRIATGAVLAFGVVGATVWAMWPVPAAVDLGTVTQGPMQVSIAAEGVTRVRDPHTITAPIAGTTTRAPVQTGDHVEAGQTLVAVIQPADPGLMDARTRAQAEAAVAEAQAAVQLADANVASAQSSLEHAQSQLERGRNLALAGTIAQRMLEDLEQAVRSAGQTLTAAQAERDLSEAALMRTRAQLLGPGGTRIPDGQANECCLQIIAPVTGTVLDVPDRNARQIGAGAPLLTIGDLTDLEIEVELLSSDAVRVQQGAVAHVERWGGQGVLDARVRRVEPAAFTRASALGIEEQRVRVRLDLQTPPEGWPGLGDQFRVMVRIVVWQGEDVLQVPHSALFRHDGGWAVFRNVNGRADLVPVSLGMRADQMAEVLDGLVAGDQVILFPASDLEPGARIMARAE
ncbi:efflux RND transporter periplasmic adaptor subunit [Roseinatronobacter alkalisoli]|uniref:HlyD family efflux transporter periplasmic adaptor subunit n=1 Tax=Roseinatronobacter alkalisoli TaxID=3028235 RepID=A0ABT5TAM9_9RHOB|nr:HlyD family efflux transporter periplasmic adaptor subunit [Roseinatronobacter sp. HJB301]MDD7971461.1 HlyD family efflux transporter periplasmic adaptor subunit [Roseinatronobacter sp. HJB301]